MGRSFLSIKLAAVFGLMVAAVVTVKQQDEAGGVTVQQVAPAVRAALAEVRELERAVMAAEVREVERAVMAAEAAVEKCGADARMLVHTARATARATQAAGATRS